MTYEQHWYGSFGQYHVTGPKTTTDQIQLLSQSIDKDNDNDTEGKPNKINKKKKKKESKELKPKTESKKNPKTTFTDKTYKN